MSTECWEADHQLKAITIRQPWAEAVARGIKTVENRARQYRPTSHRGVVAIHSAQREDPFGWRDQRIKDALDDLRFVAEHGYRIFEPRHKAFAYGSIIAVANLADCHPAMWSRLGGTRCCEPWGQPGPDMWHLTLTDVHRLDRPVPAKGSLALPWTVPADVAEQVWAQLPAEVGR